MSKGSWSFRENIATARKAIQCTEEGKSSFCPPTLSASNSGWLIPAISQPTLEPGKCRTGQTPNPHIERNQEGQRICLRAIGSGSDYNRGTLKKLSLIYHDVFTEKMIFELNLSGLIDIHQAVDGRHKWEGKNMYKVKFRTLCSLPFPPLLCFWSLTQKTNMDWI